MQPPASVLLFIFLFSYVIAYVEYSYSQWSPLIWQQSAGRLCDGASDGGGGVGKQLNGGENQS